MMGIKDDVAGLMSFSITLNKLETKNTHLLFFIFGGKYGGGGVCVLVYSSEEGAQ